MKSLESLETTYVSKFKCDGKKCNSMCCRRWIISIDDETLKKYKSIKPKNDAKKITRHIKKMKEFHNKNVIELTEDRSCPFIDENLLCRIQKNYGEDYLSTTCATYPRLNFLISDELILRSLTLSCPVAAQLILNEKRPVNFHTIAINNMTNQAAYDFRSLERGYMMPLVQLTGANILQCENLSIDERLGVLALFLESAYGAKDEKELADISEAFEKDVLKNAKALFSPLKLDKAVFLETTFSFIHSLFTGQGAHSEARIYTAFINKTFELTENADENKAVDFKDINLNALDYSKLIKFYDERFLPAKRELLRDYSLQIENFLLHWFLSTGCPMKNDIPHFAGGAAKFMLEYKISEFIFVCFKYAMGEAFHEVAIEIAAADIAKAFEHNTNISSAIDEEYKDTTEVMPIIQNLLHL